LKARETLTFFDQFIHNALLEYGPFVKQMLLKIWQNEVTLNTYCYLD